MKQLSIILLLLLIIGSLTAITLEEFFLNNRISYSLDSYIGDKFHPKQDKNQHNYREYSDQTITWESQLPYNMSFWFQLKTRDKLFERVPYINATGIRYQSKKFAVAYSSGSFELGNNSTIISRNLIDPDYDYPLLQDYEFNGLDAQYKLNDKAILNGMIGGNKFNTMISLLGTRLNSEKITADIYTMLIGRSNADNGVTAIGGMELIYHNSLINSYLGLNYHRNIEDDYDYYRFFGELIITPIPNVEIGGNFFYKDLWIEEYDYRALAAYHYRKWIFNIIYLYSKSKYEVKVDKIDYLYFIPMLRINDYLDLGFNVGYCKPEMVESYYQVGFQLGFNYEVD